MELVKDLKNVVDDSTVIIRQLKQEGLVEKMLPFFHKYKEHYKNKKIFDLRRSLPLADYLKNNPGKKEKDYTEYINEEVNKDIANNKDAIERGEEDMLRDLLNTSAGDVGWAEMLLSSQAKVDDALIQTAVTMLDMADYGVHKEIVNLTRDAWYNYYEAFDKEKPQNSTIKKELERYLEITERRMKSSPIGLAMS